MATELCSDCGSVEISIKACPKCIVALQEADKENKRLIALLTKIEACWLAWDDVPYIEEIQDALAANYYRRTNVQKNNSNS